MGGNEEPGRNYCQDLTNGGKTWTTSSAGQKQPKKCDITVSFAPKFKHLAPVAASDQAKSTQSPGFSVRCERSSMSCKAATDCNQLFAVPHMLLETQ